MKSIKRGTVINTERVLYKKSNTEIVQIILLTIVWIGLIIFISHIFISHRRFAKTLDKNAINCIARIVGEEVNHGRYTTRRIVYSYNGQDFSEDMHIDWTLGCRTGDFIVIEVDTTCPTKTRLLRDKNYHPILLPLSKTDTCIHNEASIQ